MRAARDGDDVITAGNGLAALIRLTIDGGAGNDTITGGDGNDTLIGGAGFDTFYLLSSSSTYGRDQIDGGTELDSIQFGTNASTGVVVDLAAGTLSGGSANASDGATFINVESVYGTAFGDRLTGDAGNNTLTGNGGNDTLSGGAGNDWLDGGDGNDSISGGDGNDALNSGAGSDTLDGGLGDDTYYVSPGDTILADAGGRDMVVASGSWTLAPDLENLTVGPQDAGTYSGTGNALDNVINGNGGIGVNFTLSGLGGNDSILSGYGNDSLDGGAGNDTLNGSAGNDTLTGGAGADAFAFSNYPDATSADRITDFASGTDKIRLDGSVMWALGPSGNFSPNDVRFYAAPGANAGHDLDDRVVYNTSTGQLWYDHDGSGSTAAQLVATLQPGATLAAGDIAVDNAPSGAVIEGTAGNDSLVGGAGNDWMVGYGGNDTLDGGAGADSMFGGAGDDVYYVDTWQDRIYEDQNGGTDEVRSSSSNYYQLPDWVNNLTLLPGAGGGYGNDLDNVLTGNAGSNFLYANAGNDTLIGAGGNDTMYGGDGADSFVYSVAPGGANATTIADFASGTDKVHLDARVMSALGASGNLSAGDPRFYATAGAVNGHDADDRLIYSTVTNGLYYDADGNGAGVAQLITTIQSGGTIVATDIVVDNGGSSTPGVTVNGTSGNDSLVGGAGNDTLNGFDGNDTLDGGAGNDLLIGGLGNDSIVGGLGTDTAVFSGKSADYQITDIGGGLITVTDLNTGDGNDGTDTLSGIEALKFSDQTIDDANDPPVNSVPGAQSTNEDTALVFSGAKAITVSDVDADGSDLKVTLHVDHGSLDVVNAAGLVIGGDQSGDVTLTGSLSEINAGLNGMVYTPTLNYNGPDTISYTIRDNGTTKGIANPLTATGTVAVTVTPVNDAPIANNQNVTTPENIARAITLTGSDVENDPLTFAIVTGPTNGALSGLNPNTGAVTYTPSTNFNGADSFTFRVNDGQTNSSVATVVITVTPVNDAPVANGQSVTTAEDTAKKAQPVEVNDHRVASTVFTWTGSLLAGAGETVALLFLLLASGDVFLQKLVRMIPKLRDKKQAVLVVGFRGITLHDPDRYPLELAQEACSDLGSRLFLRVREKLGLAYYVGAQNFVGLAPGYFAFYAGTAPEHAALVEQELLKEAELLRAWRERTQAPHRS
jgi:Ca2+-binding RTX toxin-like protein